MNTKQEIVRHCLRTGADAALSLDLTVAGADVVCRSMHFNGLHSAIQTFGFFVVPAGVSNPRVHSFKRHTLLHSQETVCQFDLFSRVSHFGKLNLLRCVPAFMLTLSPT